MCALVIIHHVITVDISSFILLLTLPITHNNSISDDTLWIMLKKKEATSGKGHWNCVVTNDGHTIDVEQFGPIIEYVEDPHGGEEQAGKKR